MKVISKVGKRKRVHVHERIQHKYQCIYEQQYNSKMYKIRRDGFRIIEEHERIFDLEEGGENLEKFIESTDLRDRIQTKSSLITVLSIRRVKECETKKKKKRFAKYFASLKKSYI